MLQETDKKARFEVLRGAYNDAFRQYSLQVRLLKSLADGSVSDREAIKKARHRVEQARLAYRESRDMLVQFMLSLNEKQTGAANLRAQTKGRRENPHMRSHVESLAYQLWEQDGRPIGRAEEHWYRAERLIHNQPLAV